MSLRGKVLLSVVLLCLAFWWGIGMLIAMSW